MFYQPSLKRKPPKVSHLVQDPLSERAWLLGRSFKFSLETYRYFLVVYPAVPSVLVALKSREDVKHV